MPVTPPVPCMPHLFRWALVAGTAALLAPLPAKAQETVKLGLVAAMSGQSAKAGEAIVRGLTLAAEEINAKGGVLGKKLELLMRDEESNPAKGVIAARELAQREKVAALFGGLDTPVSLAIVPFVNSAKVPFMGVWRPALRSRETGRPRTTCFESPRWTNSSTSRWSITR
jgi:branched-chain amino acid transport system substrate-binding protein